jgi:hypothetical protein
MEKKILFSIIIIILILIIFNNVEYYTDKYNPIKYNEPAIKDMGIILVYYNSAKSVRIYQNILTIIHSLRMANIPYFIAEMAFNNDPFIFNKEDNIFQYRSSSYMFYKENLIKTIVPLLPDNITKICSMDADIMFDNPKWYELISNCLNIYNICHPFTTIYRLSINYRPILVKKSCIYANSNKYTKCSPGFIWAFKRDWFIKNGFFEYAIIGGGDTLFHSYLLYNKKHKNSYTNQIFIDKYEEYVNNVSHISNIGSVDLNIYHLYHGKNTNRQYVDRHILLDNKIAELQISKFSDLLDHRDDNILEWNPKYRDEMNKLMETYFLNRDDDST